MIRPRTELANRNKDEIKRYIIFSTHLIYTRPSGVSTLSVEVVVGNS